MNQYAVRRLGHTTREEPADLGTACLLIDAALTAGTAESDEAIDALVTTGHQQLDALAAQVPPHGSDVGRLSAALGSFHGAPADYRSLESSLLPRVLERRRGLPILLSVVWLEVARRADIAASGIALPGHFVVAVGSEHEQSLSADLVAGTCTIVDPFHHGRVLELDDVLALARSHGGGAGGDSASGSASGDDETIDAVQLLEPAPPVDILHRILRNIRNWADRPERWSTALGACDLGLALSRFPIDLERDRAELLARTGRFVEASTAYALFADHAEHDNPEAADRARVLGRLARARLN
jgi:regulator of sirC expression with transglutaminase-like and TPR domain